MNLPRIRPTLLLGIIVAVVVILFFIARYFKVYPLMCNDWVGTRTTLCSSDVDCKLDQRCESGMCRIGMCGDGKKETDEECDDGNDLNEDGCDRRCRREVIDRWWCIETFEA